MPDIRTPPEFTGRVHRQSSQAEFTGRVHRQSSQAKFTG